MDLNSPRWQAASAAAFNEAWYVVASDPLKERALWVRYTFDAPGKFTIWGSWFSADGCFALSNALPSAAISRTLLNDECNGEVEAGGHSLRWKLRFRPDPFGVAENFIPGWLEPIANLRGSGFVLPRPAALVSGTVEVDGVLHTFERVAAGQAHLWGRSRYPAWAWGRCSAFAEDPEASIDLLDVVGPLGKRVAMFVLRFRGTVHRFADLPWIAFSKSKPASPSWRFSAQDATHAIDGVIHARHDRMVQLRYEGNHWCCNSELAQIEVRIRRRSLLGWRSEITLTSRGACLEFAGPERDPNVQNLLVERS